MIRIDVCFLSWKELSMAKSKIMFVCSPDLVSFQNKKRISTYTVCSQYSKPSNGLNGAESLELSRQKPQIISFCHLAISSPSSPLLYPGCHSVQLTDYVTYDYKCDMSFCTRLYPRHCDSHQRYKCKYNTVFSLQELQVY